MVPKFESTLPVKGRKSVSICTFESRRRLVCDLAGYGDGAVDRLRYDAKSQRQVIRVASNQRDIDGFGPVVDTDPLVITGCL
jgi:hypothetical protein